VGAGGARRLTCFVLVARMNLVGCPRRQHCHVCAGGLCVTLRLNYVLHRDL